VDPLAELAPALPEGRVVSGGEDLERHAGGVFTYHAPVKPDAVVYSQGRDEVVEILSFANEHRVPVVPFGQGSNLEARSRSKPTRRPARSSGRPATMRP
jgi:FAD/FMN-containing dehydrogenase